MNPYPTRMGQFGELNPYPVPGIIQTTQDLETYGASYSPQPAWSVIPKHTSQSRKYLAMLKQSEAMSPPFIPAVRRNPTVRRNQDNGETKSGTKWVAPVLVVGGIAVGGFILWQVWKKRQASTPAKPKTQAGTSLFA